jgi:hypothetical protein
MSCDRFWREGLLLFEQGLPDEHGATCLSCRRALEDHLQLTRALSAIGNDLPAVVGWQERVWREVDRPAAAPVVSRWRWWLPNAFVAACAVFALCLGLSNRQPAVEPRVEIIRGPVAVRTQSAHSGDRVRVTAHATDEIRIYRAERLVLRCRDGTVIAACLLDHELVADMLLELPGDYQVVVITAGTAPSGGTLDHDLASLRAAGGEFQLTEITVR